MGAPWPLRLLVGLLLYLLLVEFALVLERANLLVQRVDRSDRWYWRRCIGFIGEQVSPVTVAVATATIRRNTR